MEISISHKQRVKNIDTRFLKKTVQALLAELKISEAELGIHLVGKKEMARVNWQFLRHEGSTDVITFDHRDCQLPISNRQLETRNWKLEIQGELFICVDDAISQAKEFGTTWQAEIIRYTIHGVLHLLGYDDLRPALRRKMKREENRLVRRLAQRFSFAQLSRPAKLRA
jgi:probable rRNA maturation factor